MVVRIRISYLLSVIVILTVYMLTRITFWSILQARVIHRNYGYVLATHFSDQLTAGAINVFSLQCWAASLQDDVRVVEPFIRDETHLGIDESLLLDINSRERNGPKLFDFFDEKAWIDYASERNFMPLTTWGEFLSKAPSKIIIVGHNCDDVSHHMFSAPTKFAVDNGFEISRKVCTNRKKISSEMFRDLVYGEYKPSEIVVIFVMWGGISETDSDREFLYRIVISRMSKCERRSNVNVIIPESKRVIKNGEKYINRYLSSSPTSGYIGVMMRLEQFFIRHNLSEENEAGQLRYGRICIQNILKEVARHKNKSGYSKVFLAMDTGRYGSYLFRNYNHTSSDEQLSSDLFSGLFSDGSWSYQDWEKSFDVVADFSKAGYIGMIQQNVAANANILLLAGGGSFQRLAVLMHKRIHDSEANAYYVDQC